MHYLPAIPSQDLDAFYARYSESHQPWTGRMTRVGALKAAKRRAGRNGIVNEIAKRRRLSGQRLLELGCSTGSFLLDARSAGASVSGVEIDRVAREFVSAELGIPCYTSVADAVVAGPFDIVVALNIIEHLPDPEAFIGDVARMLTPGGLAVFFTPNGGQADTLGAGWVGFRVDLDHLNYFSSATLSRLLVRAGLWPEAVWEFRQAELSAFSTGDAARASAVGRLFRRWKRSDRTWALPPLGGSYVLCTFASAHPREQGPFPPST